MIKFKRIAEELRILPLNICVSVEIGTLKIQNLENWEEFKIWEISKLRKKKPWNCKDSFENFKSSKFQNLQNDSR